MFLAQAESGYLPRAMSNKLCVGIWQFSKATGHEYGLMQTASTDDRMDPEKATRAAARHLKDLYTHFGDWYLAMAAYDCGPACVDKAVMRTGYADFFELRRLNALPKETANYVPVILAMTIIGKNAPAYGLDQLDIESPVETDSVEVATSTHLALIADAIDRPLSELKELNPGLIKSVAPAGFTIHVPKGTLPAVETAFAVVPPNKRDAWRLHRVSQGETFAGLAKRYSAQTSLISQVNHEALPEAGGLVAIPVAYPGDRTVTRPLAKKTATKRHTAAPAVASVKKPASKVPQKSATKTPVRHTAALHTPNN
jgi:membrane-bound lytic murein transglycosylase D